MKTSDAGRKLIESLEGLRLTSYRDQVGVLTIGYGHTGPDVFENITISPEEADDLLAIDLHHAEDAVHSYVKVPLNQNQFDALVSFIFNVGGGNFKNSTLLKLLNLSRYSGAADQLLAWNKAGGQINEGLTNRRTKERALFLLPEAQ